MVLVFQVILYYSPLAAQIFTPVLNYPTSLPEEGHVFALGLQLRLNAIITVICNSKCFSDRYYQAMTQLFSFLL